MQYEINLPLKPRTVLEEGNKGIYEIDGLHPGYGHTLGNTLRRLLLSSLAGAAVTSVKIEGVSHEFSTIPGIKEDVIMILLNLKQLRFKMHTDEPQIVTLFAKGQKQVTGRDLVAPSQVEILNKDAPIATLTSKDSKLKLELKVEKGLGYVPREILQKEKVEIGTLILDAIFTPIRRVNYEVENMRVGERTDYHRLRFVIETDGSINPKEALNEAIKIMIRQLEAILGIEKKPLPEKALKLKEEIEEAEIPTAFEEPVLAEKEILKTRVEDLGLSSRISSALLSSGVRTVGGLIRKKEEDLLKLEGIGKKAVDEIKKALEKLNFSLK